MAGYSTYQAQEEYGNPHTLEQRLQHVARRMVNNSTGRSRLDPTRTPQQQPQGDLPTSLPQANGLPGPLPQAPAFSSAQPTFPQHQQFLSQPHGGRSSASLPASGLGATSNALPSGQQNPLSSGLLTISGASMRPGSAGPQVGAPGMGSAPGLKLEQGGMQGLNVQVRDSRGLDSLPLGSIHARSYVPFTAKPTVVCREWTTPRPHSSSPTCLIVQQAAAP